MPGFDTWLQKSRDRFISPEIQNELLHIMGLSVLRKLAGIGLQDCILLSRQMKQQTYQIQSNIVVLCLHFVDNQLVSHEEVIGLHSMDDTTAEHISRTMKTFYYGCHPPLENCRGQCNDGAS